MAGIKASAIGAVAVLGALSIPLSAHAAIQVFGGGLGESCWRAAEASVRMHMDSAVSEARWKGAAIDVCDDAIASAALDGRDLAATWVNRGILEMSREGYKVAELNFRTALAIMPKLAEAHVDLGSTLMDLKRYPEGIKETELGLALNSKEPERGYYNLGIAYEATGNLQKAYENFRTAASLKPAWQDPKDEMARFVVEKVTLQK